ncbi:MAG: CheY-like chemotaxis protein [Dokdonia sp.]|jgi:CheY-like chemotaxis protein
MINLAIIEDNDINRRIIRSAIMERYSNTVKIREFSALETFIKEDINQFDLILTDYKMPGMNGTELKPYLQKNNIEIPVVLITASFFLGEMPQIELDKVCDAFLNKPFKIEVFYTTLDLYINALS